MKKKVIIITITALASYGAGRIHESFKRRNDVPNAVRSTTEKLEKKHAEDYRNLKREVEILKNNIA